jgi:hypothetical protein
MENGPFESPLEQHNDSSTDSASQLKSATGSLEACKFEKLEVGGEKFHELSHSAFESIAAKTGKEKPAWAQTSNV